MNKEIIFSAKEYKEKYNDLLQSYLIEYEDYEEIDFINSEIQRYNTSINDLEQLEETLNFLTDLGSDIDAFVPPQCHDAAVLDETTARWNCTHEDHTPIMEITNE